MKYACVARDKSGGRCEELAVEVAEQMIFCKDHLVGPEPELALPPDLVIAQFFGGEGPRKNLMESSIRKVNHDNNRLEKKHRKMAEAVGRDPFKYGPRPSTGVPVFGKGGLHDIGGVDDLFDEVFYAGYNLSDLHWFTRDLKGWPGRLGAVLVCAFSKSAEAAVIADGDRELLKGLTRDAWQIAKVYANPPFEGKVVHAVEFRGRQTGRRGRYALRFLSGLWAAEPIPELEEVTKEPVAEAAAAEEEV